VNHRRVAALLAGVWAGGIAAIALIAAPAGFALLQRADAGAVAGRMFQYEAHAGLVLAVCLLLLVKRRAREEASAGKDSVFSSNLLLVLGAMFCTILGYFALQPMMQQARLGEGPWSFAALHGLSAALFALKGVLALGLAWRLSAEGP
jgi:hypothetical protein